MRCNDDDDNKCLVNEEEGYYLGLVKLLTTSHEMAGIPSEAVGAFVGVLIYSLINFFLCSTLVALLISYGEKFTCARLSM
jgi:hypothetical protein